MRRALLCIVVLVLMSAGVTFPGYSMLYLGLAGLATSLPALALWRNGRVRNR